MMRYYDLIETPITGRIFLQDGENRIRQDDERVICWFMALPDGLQRAYSSDGLPFNEVSTAAAPSDEVDTH